MWSKPTSATSTVTWKNWRGNLNVAGSEVAHQVVPWKHRLENPEAIESRETPIPLKPRPHCKMMVKVGLTVLTVGTVYPHTYPATGLESRDAPSASSSQNPDRVVYPPPTLVGPIPGMAAAASPGALEDTALSRHRRPFRYRQFGGKPDWCVWRKERSTLLRVDGWENSQWKICRR